MLPRKNKSTLIIRSAKEHYSLKTKGGVIKIYEASPDQLKSEAMLLLYCSPFEEILSNEKGIRLPNVLATSATEYVFYIAK